MRNGSRVLGFGLMLLALLLVTNGYADHAQFYVLDGFGGVHAGGGAPVLGAGIPYFGFDIAKGIAYVPGSPGDGVLVVDGFGGVHASGISAPAPSTPYFGFDIARDITYRIVPPRANGAEVAGFVTVTGTAPVSVVSATVVAPDDGFLLVTASTEMFCSSSVAGSSSAGVGINIDTVAFAAGFGSIPVIPDCTVSSGVQSKTLTFTQMFPVSAGAHTAHLVANDSGAVDPRFDDNTVSVIFIDQSAGGLTTVTGGAPVDPLLDPR